MSEPVTRAPRSVVLWVSSLLRTGVCVHSPIASVVAAVCYLWLMFASAPP
jgi:hypothetical protein